MTEPAPGQRRWWGWGEPERPVKLPVAARDLLYVELGEPAPAERVDLARVALPSAPALPSKLADAVGEGALLSADEERLRHAAGSSYPDLIRLRRGAPVDAPDAVVLPGSEREVVSVLEVCAREGIAVVPFGGGTSVVGGVEPCREGFDRLIALDLGRMRSVEVDPVSMITTLGPGLRGPDAEAALGAAGMTLGHFPQSFEYATVGGFAATRSAGQASSGYGRFDDLVTSVRMVTPVGVMATVETPHSAAGPALRELVVGSEGTLGVITAVSARVRPVPQARRYEGWMAPDFASGSETVRTLAQAGALPDVVRLSDRNETRLSMSLSSADGARAALADAYLAMRRRSGGCVLICGWEGDHESVERRRAVSARLLRAGGAVALGRAPGRAWDRGRYQGPYLRDELLDRGYLVDTLETAHTWACLGELYEGVGRAIAAALEGRGLPSLVLCHLSHAYRDGASLYFTFLAPGRAGQEIDDWRPVKRAACEAIVRAGATITHHHAVGRDHAPYMSSEVGEVGIAALRGAKERLDPNGIMNPGKLLPR